MSVPRQRAAEPQRSSTAAIRARVTVTDRETITMRGRRRRAPEVDDVDGRPAVNGRSVAELARTVPPPAFDTAGAGQRTAEVVTGGDRGGRYGRGCRRAGAPEFDPT